MKKEPIAIRQHGPQLALFVVQFYLIVILIG